ncbi:hypothetical protein [Streptomyces sp. WZ-12]|uniref:hypothetical protein n=1 Tax=Streptomyces sp. WZ-12 TaxID=3030210 RepID=UPI0023811F06|nr:hypothetical protein [Streptomyces sp. WZ-12]
MRVRPFYQVAESRSCLTPVRSPYAFEARVTRAWSDDMVSVQLTWSTANEWALRAAYKVSELHDVHACECAACVGDGIHAKEGA